MKQISRKLSRKILFQKLYASCFIQNDETLFLHSFFDGKFKQEIDNTYIDEMYSIILDNEANLIFIIKKYAPRFDVFNMHLSYVLPLFIGIWEMFFLKEEIPAKVSLNEAIEIAKIYGDNSAKKIVNGVLNKILENYDSVKKEIDENKENLKLSLFKKECI